MSVATRLKASVELNYYKKSVKVYNEASNLFQQEVPGFYTSNIDFII